MSELGSVYSDGGRAAAGFKGHTGDCSVRAIAIATGRPYKEVYDDLNERGAKCKITKRHPRQCRARTGVCVKVLHAYFRDLGWRWTATMGIGTGTTVHLAPDELPAGRLVARISKHLCAVIDGTVWDTGNPGPDGLRAVYGYWMPRRARRLSMLSP